MSSDLDSHYGDVVRMVEWTGEHLKELGARVELADNPKSTKSRQLPPILLAGIEGGGGGGSGGGGGKSDNSAGRMTLCVYGHLDVQPASEDDGWDSDPFQLDERDGKLYGRGSTDDKGPVISWLAAIEAFRDLSVELPVNVKFVLEGMEEFGSDGLFELIAEESKPSKFLSDVDFFCITDNYWLGKSKPCLTYGLRGLAYFCVSVRCAEQDLHSGVNGGAVPEAMTDLIKLMATLVDGSGEILVPGVMDSVKPLAPEEEKLYDSIDFDLEEFKKEVRVVGDRLLHGNKKSLLMARWRYPTLSLHGIEGAFSGGGAKTVIPAKVVGKFSLRLVPDQDPAEIERLVRKHLESEFAKLRSPNVMEAEMLHGAKAWLSSPDHPNFAAAARAVERVYGAEPDLTREGGSIPVASAFEDSTGGMNVLLLPTGACDDMAHSQNEKYNVSNYLNGIKVIGTYLHELGMVQGPKPSDCRCQPLTEEELMVPGAFIRGFKCKCEM